MFGTAASLGLGALQIGSGFEVVGWVGKSGTFLLVAIVALLTLAFVASAVSGVSRGIQWLSNINMVLALILALFVFVVGPTVLILNLLPTTIGAYAAQLAEMSARTASAGGDPRMVVVVDDLLLGVVDLLDPVRRHVPGAHQPRPHHPPVRRRRDRGSDDREPGVVRDLRRCRNRRAA